MSNNRIDRLPKWVQKKIEILEMRLSEARAELAIGWQDTPTEFCIARYHGIDEAYLPLIEYDRVVVRGVEVQNRPAGCAVQAPSGWLVIEPVTSNMVILRADKVTIEVEDKQ